MENITQSDIDNCTYDHRHLIGRYDNNSKRSPVIVNTENSINLGVQWWNKSDIKKKVCKNTDGTKSTFIKFLN